METSEQPSYWNKARNDIESKENTFKTALNLGNTLLHEDDCIRKGKTYMLSASQS